ncbi:S8 family peptidase [Cytobacillus sp. IB215665]|uniref:S8 family peptidase n=1 Tax=Cytobacillus sp. IB215665 TaxID=3097357 RepID=UPI002A14D1DE|nr:S8 family serine peptidase [Cytobacillus sp. IB215665]MDX8363796.1 S8 family serine peptidase [Cytobacillus sp. IB215665]
MKVLLQLIMLSVCYFGTIIVVSAEESAEQWLLYFDKEADVATFKEDYRQHVINIDKKIVKASFTEQEIQLIKKDGIVSLVERNYTKGAAAELQVSDPLVTEQWGLAKVNAEDSMGNYIPQRNNLLVGKEIITSAGAVPYTNTPINETEFTIVLNHEPLSRLSIELAHVSGMWQLEVFDSSGERLAVNEGNLQTLDVLLPRNETFESLSVSIKAQGDWQAQPVVQRIIGVNHLLIAVVDSGVSQHEDFCGNVLYSLGADYTGGNESVSDEFGHGTHVTGILAACMNNGIGITGLLANAPVDILPLKVLDAYGNGSDFELGVAIADATRLGADIINLSLAGKGETKMLREAVDGALEQNIVVVAAAGNWETTTDQIYPASYPGVITVSGTTPSDEILAVADFGWEVDISAPGFEILSTYKDNTYKALTGTSMATPYISSAVAFMKLANDQIDVIQIRNKLFTTAADIHNESYDIYSGAGLLQMQEAVQSETSEVIEWLTLKDGQPVNTKDVQLVGLSNGLIGSQLYIFSEDQLLLHEKAASNRIIVDLNTIVGSEENMTLTAIATNEQGQVIATNEITVVNSIEVEKTPFSDIGEEFWAYDEIYRSYELGFVNGYEDGSFRADNEITRRHSVMILARLFNWPLPTSITKSFSDVPMELSGSLAIYTAVASGIVNGYENGNFYPEENLTRGQMAVMLSRALQHNNTTYSHERSLFEDVDENHYAYNAVQQLANIGIVTKQAFYHPEANITRAQFAAMLIRTYDFLYN